MRKITIITLTATLFALTSCDLFEPIPDHSNILFKIDATPRWESGGHTEKSANTTYTFVSDTGNNLFTSESKYRIGRITQEDGSEYEFIEFDPPLKVGKPANATLRTQDGATLLYYLEVVRIAKDPLLNRDMVWLIFKESESAAERRVVQ